MDNSEPKVLPDEEKQHPTAPGAMYRRAEMRARAESLALAGGIGQAPADLPAGIPSVPAPDMAAAIGQLDPVVRAIAPLTETPSRVVNRAPTPTRTLAPRRAVALRRKLVLLAVGLAGVVVLAWLARPDTSPSSSAVGDTAPVPTPPVNVATESIDKTTATSSQAATPESATLQPSSAAASSPVAAVQQRSVVSDPVLRIASDPPGARVTVDGVGWGATPVTVRNLSPGTKRIRLTKDGYVAGERVVSLSASSGTTIQLKLRRRPVSTATQRQR